MGDPDPDIRLNFNSFNSLELADVAKRMGEDLGIDPGTLALAVAFRHNACPVAMAAMRLLYPQQAPVSDIVNSVAESQLDLSRLGSDGAVFIKRTLGIGNG